MRLAWCAVSADRAAHAPGFALFGHSCVAAHALLICAVLALGSASAHAQSVALQGMLGNKALLIIDGSAPKSIAPGDSHMGVKVLSTSGDTAVVEIKGQRANLRVGEAPASVGSKKTGVSSGSKIVLPMGSGGHFFALGTVNGHSVNFMVDTGATTIALGLDDAKRMGLDLTRARPVRVNTANGQTTGYALKLDAVRIGDVEVYDVDAFVGASLPIALLGNSFLNRFSMNRATDVMVLERR